MHHAPDQQYLNLYFQVHQPKRLKKFQLMDVGSNGGYFDDDLNRQILARIAHNCYLPANQLLLNMINRYPELKITFSISGTALEQFRKFAPEVLESFRQLGETGSVEFLGETYYHSLACLISKDEFIKQIELHRNAVRQLIGMTPTFFRNTELIYSDRIGRIISDLGFSGIYTDGVETILNGQTPNALYQHPDTKLAILLRNYQLSDDIAFRYGDDHWFEAPLTGKKFATWVTSIPSVQQIVTLALDYETFGEHKKSAAGIFDFLNEFLYTMLMQQKFRFINPTEACRQIPERQILPVHRIISWADQSRDLSAWLGNPMQRDAFDSLCKFYDEILTSDNSDLIDTYRNLQTSDHFYYMATNQGTDEAVHQYFSPYESPYTAFMNFMNCLFDLECRLRQGIRQIETSAPNTNDGFGICRSSAGDMGRLPSETWKADTDDKSH